MSSPALHLRAPLLWVLVPLMAGLTAARIWPAPAGGLGPLIGAAGLAGMGALWWARRPGRGAALAWGCTLGMAAAVGGFVLLHTRHPAWHRVESRPPREITVTVRVQQAFPAAAATRSLTGLAEIIATSAAEQELLGRRIYYSAIRRISVPPQRSGSYVLRGVIESLPRETGDPGFNSYLANLGIRQRITRAQLIAEAAPPTVFQQFFARAQDRMEGVLRVGLTEQPQAASLYLAMLLGEKAELSAEQQNAFMRSGTFHIFSISGLHVGVIGMAIYVSCILLRMPRRPAVAITLVVLWLYVAITGASSPAVRAFLMIAFLLATEVFRLPGNALAALVAAALVTLLLDPLQLFSTGFQMSYAVVAALVAMGRPLGEKWLAAWRPFALLPPADWRWPHRMVAWGGRWILGMSAACWTAFLASTPAGIGYFQVFSPGALVANLVIIPLSSVAIWTGFISLVAGLPGLLPLSALANGTAALIIRAMDWLLMAGIELPGVYFNAHFRAGWLAPVSLGLMTAAFLAGAAGRWAPRYGGYWLPVGTLALLLILGVKFG